MRNNQTTNVSDVVAGSLLVCLAVVAVMVGVLNSPRSRAGLAQRVAGENNHSNEQRGGNQNPPVVVPGDAVDAADAQEVQRDNQSDYVDNADSGQPLGVDWPESLDLIATCVMAAATIFLAIYGGFQLHYIARQIAVAEESVLQLKLERRAWITADARSINPITKGDPIRVTVMVHNSGQTPAEVYACKRKLIRLSELDAEYLLKEAIDDKADWRAQDVGFVVTPGKSLRVPLVWPGPADDESANHLNNRGDRIYPVVQFSYRDNVGTDGFFQLVMKRNPTEGDGWELIGNTSFNESR